MQINPTTHTSARRYYLVLLLLFSVNALLIFGESIEEFEITEEVITVGTRTSDRSTIESTVPVQLFDEEEIESVATATDLIDVVQRLVPSFNVSREPISDGASFMRPPFVRGLDSDKVLVLLNNKRRHKGALVRLGGSGTHGADIASIPVSALKTVEVLYDGASALYGSDAIAGVINFKLKDTRDSSSFTASVGEYTQGGGDVRFTSNLGLPLLQGFINLSAEYSDSRGTSRGQRYDLAVGGGSGLTPAQSAEVAVDTNGDGVPDRFGPDSLTEIRDQNGTLLSLVWGADGIPDDTTPKYRENLANPEQVWGEPIREDAKLSANFAIPMYSQILGDVQIYGFGNWRDSESTGSFFYRRPGVGQLNPIRLRDGSIFNPRDRFPGGFTPKFTGNINDLAGVLGLRGNFSQSVDWDLSLRYGSSTMNYQLKDTWNPSMGPSSPTTFHPGELNSSELALNFDFEWTLVTDWLQPVVVAFGFDFRRDSYEIRTGDPASYLVGPFAHVDPFNWDITEAEVDADPNDALETAMCRIPGHAALIANNPDIEAQPGGNCIAGDPIYNVMAVGSNGFPGYPPQYSIDRTRDGGAAYVDLSFDIGDDWVVDLASRIEDAGAYGNIATWKFATKYRFTKYFAIRSSIGTGFKAPTIGQISTVSVVTRINSQGIPVAEGIFPTGHPVAAYFGAVPLNPETSTHITAGIVLSSATANSRRRSTVPLSNQTHAQSRSANGSTGFRDNWSVTLDGYVVELEDRLTLSSPFVVDERAVADLIARGVANANSIAQVVYFTNSLKTRSEGLDIVGTYRFINRFGTTELVGTVNWNKIEIVGQVPQTRSDGTTFLLINAEGLYDFENTWPRYRGVLTAYHHLRGGTNLMVRANRFGSHRNASNTSLEIIQTFSSEWQLDAHVEFYLKENLTVTAAVTNAFDAVPDTAQFEACCGRIVRSDSLVPWQGPYYSLTMRYRSY
ncbi:MAG: TonB-dependent receptor plug domain-containing protein [Gammaproteobacteria bacterium]|nr:TonB-dependent receptor plug domain-containing protein [Gammaproteobacteria bacterium]